MSIIKNTIKASNLLSQGLEINRTGVLLGQQAINIVTENVTNIIKEKILTTAIQNSEENRIKALNEKPFDKYGLVIESELNNEFTEHLILYYYNDEKIAETIYFATAIITINKKNNYNESYSLDTLKGSYKEYINESNYDIDIESYLFYRDVFNNDNNTMMDYDIENLQGLENAKWYQKANYLFNNRKILVENNFLNLFNITSLVINSINYEPVEGSEGIIKIKISANEFNQ